MREVSYQALVIPTKLVPAEAGSGNPVFLATSGFWIPASAGMTVIFATPFSGTELVIQFAFGVALG